MEESVGENRESSYDSTASPAMKNKQAGTSNASDENRGKEELSQAHSSLRPSKRLELLMRLGRCYPDRWNDASLKHLLRDLAIAKVACSQENVHGTMEEIEEKLIFSLAEICLMQHEKLISIQATMSEKEKKYVSTILSLQEEKNEIKQGLVRQNMFVETLLQDFDEMGKAMDYSRQKQRHLEQLLEEKESNIQLLVSEKEELINKFVREGTNAVLKWAKREGKFQDSVEVGPSRCESAECSSGYKESDSTQSCISKTCSSVFDGRKTIISAEEENFITSLSLSQEKRPNLVVVTLNGILEEAITGLSSVVESGVSALPGAVAFFWIGLTGRVVRHVSDTVIMKVKGSPLGFCWDP